MATQAEFAQHVGISQQAVADLLRRQVIPCGNGRGGLDLDACRISYIEHLREVAAGRAAATDGELDLVAERARVAKEQADGLAMKNELMRGETVYVRDIVEPFGQELSGIRSRFLAIPSEHAPSIHRCKTVSEVQGRLTDIIHEVLTQMSEAETFVQGASRASKHTAGSGDGGQEGGDDASASVSQEPAKRHPAGLRRDRRHHPRDRRDAGRDNPGE
jgi:phage terminase Nu1 subunit (DNA packaging protein)